LQAKKQFIKMPISKYSLQTDKCIYSVGYADFKNGCGSILDTNGCIVLLTTSGYATATINFKERMLRKGDLVILLYDDVFTMNAVSKMFSTQYVAISYELTEEVFYKINSIDFWDLLYEHPKFSTSDEQWNLLQGWWQQMKWLKDIDLDVARNEMVKNNLLNLLLALNVEISRNIKSHGSYKKNHGYALITVFFKLVANHCRQSRNVRFYADKMSITTTYLYKLCRTYLQQSPKEVIGRQTVSEIKTYLANTDLSVKGIAAALNFEDASYMCRYFRRLTGLSPADYRNNNYK